MMLVVSSFAEIFISIRCRRWTVLVYSRNFPFCRGLVLGQLCGFSKPVPGHRVYFCFNKITVFFVTPPMLRTGPPVWFVTSCSVYIVVL